MFIYLLNRFRTKTCYEMSCQESLFAMSEMIKFVLDEVESSHDTNIAL